MKGIVVFLLVALFVAAAMAAPLSKMRRAHRYRLSSRDVLVNCPGGSSCKAGETCCQDTSGGYACCPYPNADCCSDHLHCCPGGYQCDLSKGECVKGGSAGGAGGSKSGGGSAGGGGGSGGGGGGGSGGFGAI
eukprot:TRINITY_DN1392_c0_g2_i1.p1 TRINITY_DN1392_c0_g2~~TRINITY_DN1392_c0_g2_i1.p1  ORF type:complete len:133 (+),score=16.54 TRINITY_DN1392_c0_g2_i1:136-534(+)